MAGRVVLVLCLLVSTTSVLAGTALDVAATATAGARVALRLEVRNTGDAPASDVAPEVVYQGRDEHGDPLPDLAPGTQHVWSFDLPPPAEPGTVPAVIHVRYVDGQGRRTGIPAVATVSTTGLLPEPEVRATLTTSPVTRFAQALLVLENPSPTPIHGRVVVVLPGGLGIEPESQPAEVAAEGSSRIPLVLQNRGEPPGGAVPIFALFEYAVDGRWHLAVASASAAVAGGGPALPPLAVGTGALGLALGLLALAWWRAARRRHLTA